MFGNGDKHQKQRKSNSQIEEKENNKFKMIMKKLKIIKTREKNKIGDLKYKMRKYFICSFFNSLNKC